SVPELETMVAKTSEELGGIDILVNNAGVRVHKLIDHVTEEDYDRLMAVNLKAPYFASKLVIPHMERRGGGKIIHIASQFGHVGTARSSIYCAAKGGLVNLTRVMAVELAGRGINVNTVSPGPIATEFLLARFEREPGGREERLSKVPCGRLGTPEEVADAALFLASGEASYIHGHSLVVDGGYIAH
ncbi:MAG: SDR family NAD(P)-dependent oxidoreductase, partial [Nitrospinota bacterium]